MKKQRKRNNRLNQSPSSRKDSTGPLLPSGREDALLPFYRKDGDGRFEQICVEIAEKEPSIRQVDKKNRRYRQQYGVDVEACDENHDPVFVISCKCYAKITSKDLTAWSDDFLRNWDEHWKSKGVRQFVLAVSVELNNDQLQDAIRVEKQRFRLLGLKYECWGTQQLTSKLKREPLLVARLFNQTWAEAICGTHILSQIAGDVGGQRTSAYLFTQTGDGVGTAAMLELGDTTERRLEELQRCDREGDRAPLTDFVQTVRQKPIVWESLNSRVKSRFLRTEALGEISHGKLTRAGTLLDEADAFYAAADRTARTLLLYRRDGPQQALEYLSDPTNGSEAHLRAALLLEANQCREATKLLNDPIAAQPAIERFRLLATAHALSDDTTELISALAELDQAAGADFASKLTAAMLRFHLSLANGAHLQLGPFPNPVPPTLARQDARSVAFRSEAIGIIDNLLTRCDAGRKRALEVWKLAFLLMDERRHHDGLAAATKLVGSSDPHPGAIAWALSYGAKIDRKLLATTLQVAVERDGSADQVAALALLTRIRRGAKAALQIIDKYGSKFVLPEDKALMAMWHRQLSKPKKANEYDRLQFLVERTRKTKKCSQLIAHLSAASTSAEDLASGAEFLAQSGYRAELNELRQKLLSLGTSRALEMSIEGAFASKDYAAIKDLVDVYRATIDAHAIRYRLRVIASEAGWRRGDLRAALDMLELDSMDLEAADAGLRRARLAAGIGNIEGAARLFRVHSQKKGVDPLQHLDLAYHVRHVDPDLSRTIVERAAEQRLEGSALASVMHMAFELGLKTLQDRLMPEFQQQAVLGALPGVFALNVEDMSHFIRKQSAAREQRQQIWLQGEVPIHIAFEADTSAILGIYLGVCSTHDTRLPMLLRAASIDLPTSPLDLGKIKIRVDITALLLAVRLNLLDLLDQAAEVSVSLAVGNAIRELEDDAVRDIDMRQLAPMLIQLRQHVVNRLETGRWKGLPQANDPQTRSAGVSTQFARSLFDICADVPAVDTVCWIEDRCASFAPTIGGVPRIDVLTLCKALHVQNDDGRMRAAAIRHSLSLAGYLFGVWSPEDQVAEISKIEAPRLVDGHQTLTSIKLNYAQEITNFVHLNKQKRRDTSALAMPIELHYAARTFNLASQLMPALWKADGGKTATIIPRARWCWLNLRCEQTPYFPFENQDDKVGRNLRFSSIFQLAMTGALGTWDTTIVAETERRQEYLTWVFREIIDPMVSVEPDLEGWLTEQISATFLEYLNHGDDIIAKTEHDVLKLVVSQLVDGFPELWRKRIRSSNDLNAALGSKVENVVTIGEDIVFRANDFATAIAQAFRSGEAELSEVYSGKACMLKGTGTRSVSNVVVELGTKRLQLTDTSFGLLSEDTETQRRAALALAREVDIASDQMEAFVGRILAVQGSGARMNEIAGARKESYATQLKNLQEAVRKQVGVDYDLLRPPSPETLARYLRIDLSADPQEWRCVAVALSEQVGLLQAGKRLAGTTLKLDDDFKRSLGDAILEEQKQSSHPKLKAPTPLYALLVLQALVRSSNATAEDRENAINDLVRCCAEGGAAYCALLRWCYRTIDKQAQWRALTCSARDLLLMTHADLVLGTLIVEGAMPTETAKIFDASDELQLAARLDRTRPEPPPPLENATSLSAHILATALRDCTDELFLRLLASKLRQQISVPSGDRWLAHPLITGPAQPFHHWSWADCDAAAELANLQVVELLPPFDRRDPALVFNQLFQQIENPETAATVFLHLSMLDLRKVDSTKLAMLLDIARRHSIDINAEPFSSTFHICTRLMMTICGARADRDQAVSMCTKWASLAATRFIPGTDQAQRSTGGENWTGISQLLDNCLAYLYGAAEVTAQTCVDFSDCVDAVARAWPPAREVCVDFLVQVADQLDVSRSKALWFTLQRMRSNSGSVSRLGRTDVATK